MDPLRVRHDTAKHLIMLATPRKNLKRTERMYIVTVYEENTEFSAAMEMLADIAKWFSVKAI